MNKILILGSSGNLGNQIYKNLKKKVKFKLFHTGLKKRKIDLTNEIELEKFILSVNPDLIINCIALTSIDECESFKLISKKINFGIVKSIFQIKNQKKLKFKFIHFSTDQFYNQKGKKSSKEVSKIFLINNYCYHKRMAELKCIKNKSLVFRTNFFGKSPNNKTFSDWIFNSFRKKKKIYLFDDVYFNPLRLTTIANIITMIIVSKKYQYSGVYNLGSKDGISKSDFAIQFANKARVLNNNYKLMKINKLLKIRRSNNMFMNVEKFENKFKFKLPLIKSEIKKEANRYF